MKNEHDMDLNRLFAGRGEVEQDEMFVVRVSKRIALRRYARRVVKTLFVGAGLAILAALIPRPMDLTYSIALGSDLFACGVVALAVSPVGWAIGGGVGLFFFLRTRS
jgi:hypothetical protein